MGVGVGCCVGLAVGLGVGAFVGLGVGGALVGCFVAVGLVSGVGSLCLTTVVMVWGVPVPVIAVVIPLEGCC